MEPELKREIIDEIFHKLQTRVIIIGIPALLILLLTLFQFVDGEDGKPGLPGKQGPPGKDGISAVFPVATIIPFAGDISQMVNGWKYCNGEKMVISEYKELYDIIGINYGGEKGIYFNLPDLRGRFPVGRDNMGEKAANRVTSDGANILGGSGGEEKHTLSLAEMPHHNHDNGAYKYLLRYTGQRTSDGQDNTSGEPDVKHKGEIVGKGGGLPHNNMPPYLTLNYIIKVKN